MTLRFGTEIRELESALTREIPAVGSELRLLLSLGMYPLV